MGDAALLRQMLTSDFHYYVVTVETGNTKWSGTNQQVRIQLYGDRGQTEEVALEASETVEVSNKYSMPSEAAHKELFAIGSVREFRFKAYFVGNMVKIRVSHGDNHAELGHSASWKLDRVVVKDDDLQRSWAFMCQTWFTHDNHHECEFVHTGNIAAGRRASVRQARRRSMGLGEQSLSRVARMRSKFDTTALESVSNSGGDGGVRRVCFQLHWNRDTNYDIQEQYMYLFGAPPALGAWDPTKAIRMNQYTGADGTWRGEWRLEMEMDDDFDLIEYQYLIIDEKNDRVLFFDKSFVLKLSNPTDVKDRTVEGGMIYVRDSIDSSLSAPFVELKPGAHKFRTPVKLSGVNASARRKPATLRKMPAADRRNSIGFMPRGGSTYLQTPTYSKFFVSPDAASGDEKSTPDAERAPAKGKSDSTSKLRSELRNSQKVIEKTREQLRAKSNEIESLKENLGRYSENGIGAIFSPGRGASPITSDQYDEQDGDLPVISVNPPAEDARSETPEATDSEGADVDEAVMFTPPQNSKVDVEKFKQEAREAQEEAASLREQLDELRQAAPPEPKVDVAKLRVDNQKALEQLEKAKASYLTLQRQFEVQCDSFEKKQTELENARDKEAARLRAVTEERNRITQELEAEKENGEVINKAYLDEKNLRKKLHEEVLDLKGNIRVFCRVRPLKKKKDASGQLARSAISFPNEHIGEFGQMVVGDTPFSFVNCFTSTSTQAEVYEATSGVVGKVLDGHNVCIMAYGQTGSGKTHTMIGPEDDRGVNYKAIADVFRLKREREEYCDVLINVGMIEIYKKDTRDLLQPKVGDKLVKLPIRKKYADPKSNAMHLPDMKTYDCDSEKKVWRIIDRGFKQRATASTDMNQTSSRSHSIVQVKVTVKNKKNGQVAEGLLSLVDLAGSEDVSKSGVVGIGLKEAAEINSSLTSLSTVFDKLEEKMRAKRKNEVHIPYRDSPLTNLLCDSIGGNAKCLMFINISCDYSDVTETTRSLRFGSKVSAIELGKSKAPRQIVQDGSSNKRIAELQAENEGLDKRCEVLFAEGRKKDEELKKLQTRITKLQGSLEKTQQKVSDAAEEGDGKITELEEEIAALRKKDREKQAELKKVKGLAHDAVKKRNDRISELEDEVDDLKLKLQAAPSRGAARPATGRGRTATRSTVTRANTVSTGVGAAGNGSTNDTTSTGTSVPRAATTSGRGTARRGSRAVRGTAATRAREQAIQNRLGSNT